MMETQRGGLASGIKGQLCKTLCRLYIHIESDQNCSSCSFPEKCEAMAEDILKYSADRREIDKRN